MMTWATLTGTHASPTPRDRCLTTTLALAVGVEQCLDEFREYMEEHIDHVDQDSTFSLAWALELEAELAVADVD